MAHHGIACSPNRVSSANRVSLIVMTSPARFPERGSLFAFTLSRLIRQTASHPERNEQTSFISEIIVLDDQPACAAWPATADQQEAATDSGVELRYVALPPREDGYVCMRLKRNSGLQMCTGDVAIFCDDDDWRSPDSVQTQLEALHYHSADVCTISPTHICEVDPTRPSPEVRFFDLQCDHARIFSSRLGNPGTLAVRRHVWEGNADLGFPETSCEDMDYLRLLLSNSPIVKCIRNDPVSHVLVDQMELNRQRIDHPIFMTVRLIGHHHEWPLQALSATPSAGFPKWLHEADIHFYHSLSVQLFQRIRDSSIEENGCADAQRLLADNCPSIRRGASEGAILADARSCKHPNMTRTELELALSLARKRMDTSTKMLLLISAQAHERRSRETLQCFPSQDISQDNLLSEKDRISTGRLIHQASLSCENIVCCLQHSSQGVHVEKLSVDDICDCLDALRQQSADHRMHNQGRGRAAESAVAEYALRCGIIHPISTLLSGFLTADHRSLETSQIKSASINLIVSSAVELCEEMLYRTSIPVLEAMSCKGALASTYSSFLASLAALIGYEQLGGGGQAAAAGSLQHLFTKAEARNALMLLPSSVCADQIAQALASSNAAIRRRAAGAVFNACESEIAINVMIEAGAASHLALHLLDSASVPQASLRALARLCATSAIGRDQVATALPLVTLLNCLEKIMERGPAEHTECASRVVAAMTRSESRHWLPCALRGAARTWPHESIVYYTGMSLEPWGPSSLGTGLGGSETAVLQLASHWAGAGRDVTIYLRLERDVDMPTAKTTAQLWQGVHLKDVKSFNPNDSFGTLIVWRSLEILDEALCAQLLLLDLHDMPRVHDITEKRMQHVDCIMVKSHFQRNALPAVALSKPVAIVPNGVDTNLVARTKARVALETSFDACSSQGAGGRAQRVLPPCLVYTSSYDRGLEQMLRYGWPVLTEAVPGVTLHLYYGWRTHELMYPISPWRDDMRRLIASFGASVIDHGRVGQSELMLAKAQAQVLYYIGHWPEVDCIAAREAAMLGCVPVTSRVGVFNDLTKDYCIRIDGDPLDKHTQQDAAKCIAALLHEYERSGELPNVDTQNLRSESWKCIAARWLEVIGGRMLQSKRNVG